MSIVTHTLRVYLARDGWRWRLTAKNGRTVADSAEAYARKRNAVDAAEALLNAIMVLEIDETPATQRVRGKGGKFAGSKKAAR